MENSKKAVFLLVALLLPVSLHVRADEIVVVEQCTCPCPCPAPAAEDPSPDSDECPEEVSIREFPGGVYGPVDFPHRRHAELADEGCAQCHHHAAPRAYQACHACHKTRTKLVDKPQERLMPDLNGAFHRQCIGCHLDMESGPVACTGCHAETKDEKNEVRQPPP